MTVAEYEAYRQDSASNYAAEVSLANGFPLEHAIRIAETSFRAMLPEGLSTPNQFLFSLFEKNTAERAPPVGMLWFGIKEEGGTRKAFIYDILVHSGHQGKGYGKAAMRLLEDEVRRLGLKRIGLHVFAHNGRARALYESLGYVPTNLVMQKQLD